VKQLDLTLTHEKETLVWTKKELFINQAQAFNFEKDADQLLQQALQSGFVDEIGEDQYQVNLNYN
jgi:hypothetical protein|tara:strand:- start:1 stop:195 length:195 start_codon:yes stop_codon:yes gene_type:complete